MDFANLVNLGNMLGSPGGSDGKESSCSAGDPRSIPGSGRSPGEENGNSFQYSRPGQRSLAGYGPWGSQRVGHDWNTNAFTLQETIFPKSSSPNGSGLGLVDVENVGVRFWSGSEKTAINGGRSLQSETMTDGCQSRSSLVLALLPSTSRVLSSLLADSRSRPTSAGCCSSEAAPLRLQPPDRPLPEASSHLRRRPSLAHAPVRPPTPVFQTTGQRLREPLLPRSDSLSQLLPHLFNF